MTNYYREHKALFLWLLIFFVLLAFTLNNTTPYKGDESYYLVSALSMIKTGEYFVPHYYNQPRFQKPILAYWITVLGYKIFGIRLWSGRLPFLILSLLLLILIYRFAFLVINDKKFAFLNVVLLSSSAMYILFSRAAMTDLLLTFFSTLSLYFFYKAIIYPDKIKRYYFYAYVSIGFAFLSKGWIGFLPAVIMLIYLFLFKPKNFKKYVLNLFHPLNIITLCIISFSWYLYVFIVYKEIFLSQLKSETSGKFVISLIGEKIIYYTGVLIRYYFPFTLIGVYLYIKKSIKLSASIKFLLLYFIITIFIYAFFISMYRSRYLLPSFPVITLIIGFIIYKSNLTEIMKKIGIILFILQAIILLVLPIIRKEPIKEIAKYVESKKYSNFSAYNLDKRNMGWLLIFTEGKVKRYNSDSKYVIIKEGDYNKFKNYTIEKEAVKLKKIKFENNRFNKNFKKFLLLRKAK